LYGADDLINRIALQVTTGEHTPLMSIEGLGGIGKTALARAVAQRLAERGDFLDVIWISARHEYLDESGTVVRETDPAYSLHDMVARLAQALGLEKSIGLPTAEKLNDLHALLSKRAYLIIIDNLETIADSESPFLSCVVWPASSLYHHQSRHAVAFLRASRAALNGPAATPVAAKLNTDAQ
jgi:predicted ATPase